MSKHNWLDQSRLAEMIAVALNGPDNPKDDRYLILEDRAAMAGSAQAEPRDVFAAFLVSAIESLDSVNFSDTESPNPDWPTVACTNAQASFFLRLCRKTACEVIRSHGDRGNIRDMHRFARIGAWPDALPSGVAPTRVDLPWQVWIWAWHCDREVVTELQAGRLLPRFIDGLVAGGDRLQGDVWRAYEWHKYRGLLELSESAIASIYRSGIEHFGILSNFDSAFQCFYNSAQRDAMFSLDDYQRLARHRSWAAKALAEKGLPLAHPCLESQRKWSFEYINVVEKGIASGDVEQDAARFRETVDPVERFALFQAHGHRVVRSHDDPFGPYTDVFCELIGSFQPQNDDGYPPRPTYEQCLVHLGRSK